ncbi:hypothetical protein [Chryseobacterium gambrini]|uniref:Uncharacterized protein n=1 Tax=Chryseobacterium gambrini TaxID=373672 RepID=A0ABM8K5E1_9FLAO|nr:hypothetical protein CRDW_11910 [Chryseobacterium gambrini]
MKLIDTYEKDGITVEVNSLLTTKDSVIDIKQIFILNDVVYISFDTVQDRILMSETAEIFIWKYREYLNTLTKKVFTAQASCKCQTCQ